MLEGTSIGPPNPPQNVSCSDLFNTIVERVRTDDTSEAINSELDWLGDNCPTESGVWPDYMSARGFAEQYGAESCDSWNELIRREAIDLLSEEGLCIIGPSPAPAGETAVEEPPDGGIPWSDAASFVGTNQRVCGPLADVGYSNDDVFLNIGRNYPDPGRFTIVLWDIGGVEPISPGTTLCTEGDITLFEGVPQIQQWTANSVELLDQR
ncbi:hypothetical protein [Georgenia sp. SUBG003]|uniref:hypothetical protein n=1 Tax=Georgenia sp. SUBG003 TaxID=1497974 RepID=UPI003AB45653